MDNHKTRCVTLLWLLTTGQAAAKPGLQALMDSCQARQPQLVKQMESMMAELEHMSVLWTEQWHIALLELQVIVQPYAVPSCVTPKLGSPSLALGVSRIKCDSVL